MLAPLVGVTDVEGNPRGRSGLQPPIVEVPVIARTEIGARNAAEGENAVENERRYPR